MNRLWVRLSLMISGVLFLMFFMQFLVITLEKTGIRPDLDGPMDAPPTEIQGRLLEFMFFSVLVGTAGGIMIAAVVSAPISSLTKAVRRVGNGELDVRVPVRGSEEIRQLGESFNIMAADLQRAETMRNNLMADVSHELRTPLTCLEGNLRAALDRVVPLDDAEIANLYSQTRHLTRLVNDLRELSLAESSQLPLERIPVNVKDLVSDTVQALEPLAADNNISLVNEIPGLLELTLDPIRIRQVLFNLLTNALRHTPAGGKIVINSEIEAGEVVISVRDNGEGLEAEQLLAVFDRFYRVDKSRSRESGGTGLGLAIVKAIVEAHGGRMQVESPGKGLGTTFTMIFPIT